MSIYTRTGDDGTTALFGGKRVLKCIELVDVYGSIDELNSWVGLIAANIQAIDVQDFLYKIQSDLFTIGSTLAGWKGDLTDVKKRVSEMEARIDQMEEGLPKITNFIIPGGAKLSSQIHITRSICRRVERQLVRLVRTPLTARQDSSPIIDSKSENILLIYINRLSDLFFILARFINKLENIPEHLWSGKKSI
jgi:cob(I)alamin adenosyltransferase